MDWKDAKKKLTSLIRLGLIICILLIVLCGILLLIGVLCGLSVTDVFSLLAIIALSVLLIITFSKTIARLYSSNNRVLRSIAITTMMIIVFGGMTVFIIGVNDEATPNKHSDERAIQDQTSTPNTSDANKGYMTRQDDELLTKTALKKDMGQSLTKDEQDYLDAANAGKFGKPYGDRPDKDHNSPDSYPDK